MRAMALAAAVLFVAGCLTPAPAAPPEAGADASVWLTATAPTVDARATLDALKAFSEAYPYRQTGTATHKAARDALEQAFADAGLETMRQAFPASFRGAAPIAYDGENVIGIKWGADRTRWIVIGAHYDITEGAVHGAYDDGSGTILVQKLAEAFAGVETQRTIAFIQFDQEERGLLGSRYFVESVLDGTFEHEVVVDGMIDLDMVGITWPHPADLVVWENSPTLEGWTTELAAAVGVPADHLQFRKPKGGVSDGAAFIEVGIATAYFWSDWDEVVTKDGQEVPGPVSYPFWHQADTYDSMVVMAGDEATLEAGFQTTLDVVSPLLLRMTSPAFVPDPEEAPAE